MNKATPIKNRLDVLEAERAILTIELRDAVTRAAHALLPEAIRQAKPSRKRGKCQSDGAVCALVRNDYAGLASSFVDGEKWHMRKGATFLILSLTLSLVAGLSCRSIIGQEHANANTNAGLASYDVKREVTLTGTVLAFIPTSQVAPLGAHLTLQTQIGRASCRERV